MKVFRDYLFYVNSAQEWLLDFDVVVQVQLLI